MIKRIIILLSMLLISGCIFAVELKPNSGNSTYVYPVLDFDITEYFYFGFSSQPSTSDPVPYGNIELVSHINDNRIEFDPATVYVFWNIISTEPVVLELSAQPLTNETSEGRIDMKIDAEDKTSGSLGFLEVTAALDDDGFYTNTKRLAEISASANGDIIKSGYVTLRINVNSLDPKQIVPGEYKGNLRLEIKNE